MQPHSKQLAVSVRATHQGGVCFCRKLMHRELFTRLLYTPFCVCVHVCYNRVSDIMLGLWIILMFGSGIPSLYVWGLLWLLVVELTDRWSLARVCQTPARYGKNLPFLLLGKPGFLRGQSVLRHTLSDGRSWAVLVPPTGLCTALYSLRKGWWLRECLHCHLFLIFLQPCVQRVLECATLLHPSPFCCRSAALGCCDPLCLWAVDAHTLQGQPHRRRADQRPG
jgi:hypothetical protein